MKFNNIILIIFTVLSIACSSDTGSDSGDSNSNGNNTGGNNNNNGGNNSGGSSSSGETTDPNDFSSTTSPGNTTYYISFSNGNDSNDGKSEDKPFKNLGKINSITYKAGDKIMFKSGDTWRGYFKLLGSGDNSNKIEISNYGTGTKPMEMAIKRVFF